MSLSLIGSFKFPSLIVYLFLYQNGEEFMHLGLNIMDIKNKRQSVVFWTDVVRTGENEYGLFDFASYFMSVAYKILNGVPPPCFLPKPQEYFHLGVNWKFGDWFFFRITLKLSYMDQVLSLMDFQCFYLWGYLPWNLFDKA